MSDQFEQDVNPEAHKSTRRDYYALERFLNNGMPFEGCNDFDPSTPRWPRIASKRKVDISRCTIIGHLSDDLETGEEVFTESASDAESEKGWVAIGKIKVDVENETETFTRIPVST